MGGEQRYTGCGGDVEVEMAYIILSRTNMANIIPFKGILTGI
jgi:hypothetical protein